MHSGSLIATIVVLDEAPDPAFFVTTVPCIFSGNYISWIIGYHSYMYSYNVCFKVK